MNTKKDLAFEGGIITLIPMVAVAGFVLLANFIFIFYRLRLPYPASAWDAGIVTDAWRMLQGEKLYAIGTDHATQIYGPCVTALLAQVFRFTGPVLLVGRLASAISGVAVVVLLAKIFAGRERFAFLVCVALLLAANTRTNYYFTEIRPDLDSLFLATLALIVLYRGLERSENSPLAFVVAGSALLVIASLFKQTAVGFALVPIFASIGHRKRLLMASIPLVAVGLTFAGIYKFAPGLWHFMVEVLEQYHIPPFRAGEMTVEFFATLPLFGLTLVHWLATDAADTWRLPLVRWLLVALMVAIPASILAEAKDGGTTNSLLPALFAISAFCGWRIAVAFRSLRDAARPIGLRIALGIVFAVMLFVQVYAAPGSLKSALKKGQGTSERIRVIEEASLLPGKVVCPDDPTIPLFAKGYAGRTAVFEADAVYFDPRRLENMIKEIQSADYVITLRDGLPEASGVIGWVQYWENTQHLLTADGFRKVPFRTVSSPVYELWRRETATTAPIAYRAPASRPDLRISQ